MSALKRQPLKETSSFIYFGKVTKPHLLSLAFNRSVAFCRIPLDTKLTAVECNLEEKNDEQMEMVVLSIHGCSRTRGHGYVKVLSN